MKTNILISSVLFTAFLLTACGGGGGKAAMCDAIVAKAPKDQQKAATADCMKEDEAKVKAIYDAVQKMPK